VNAGRSYLGIDIGGTKVAMRLEGTDRPPLNLTVRWPNPPGPVDADLDILGAALAGLRSCWDAEVVAVGVAVPATVDASGRITVWPNRPSWAGLELAPTLAGMALPATIRWADDGDLAGLAEARAAGLTDAVYLGVGTGIGGGIVSAGVSTVERGRGSAELGHIVVDRLGPRCGCGRRGCLQAIAAGPATLARASEAHGSKVDFAELVRGWSDGETWAVDAVTASCEALAVATISINEMLHPEAVVIGGGFAAGLPGFAAAVRRCAQPWARQGHPPPAILAARLGGLSSLYGAVELARIAAG
jgi:kanosamine 6-kinase